MKRYGGIARGVLACCVLLGCVPHLSAEVQKFARFRTGTTVAYGLVEGERVRQLSGDLFGKWQLTEQSYSLEDVELLVPVEPTQVLALAGNYRSHINEGKTTTIVTTTTTLTRDEATGQESVTSTTNTDVRKPGEVPERFQEPQPFFKSLSCLLPAGGEIILPQGATTVHYEAELVIVIGKEARNVEPEQARDYVFGVTCGNDISERNWQKNDVQWWRAKGSDTFGPCGPFIARGLDYDNLLLELRLNGELRQQESTKMLIHDVASTVSFISKHVTLHPGDLIFTGTPGTTDVLQPGDVVEVGLQGVGVLRNTVRSE